VSIFEARLIYSETNFSDTGVRPGPALDVTYAVKKSVMQAVKQQSSVAIVLRGVTLPEDATGVFDVMSVRGSSMKPLGIVAIVGDAMRMSALPRTVVLDATDALDDLFDTSNPARLTLVRREGNGSLLLQTEDIDIRLVSRP
jgi:hypothetical protein